MAAKKIDEHGNHLDFVQDIGAIVRYHIKTLGFVDALNEIFGQIFWAEVAFSCLQMCFLIFTLNNGSDKRMIPFNAMVFTAISIQMMIYCFGGEKIKSEVGGGAEFVFLSLIFVFFSISRMKCFVSIFIQNSPGRKCIRRRREWCYCHCSDPSRMLPWGDYFLSWIAICWSMWAIRKFGFKIDSILNWIFVFYRFIAQLSPTTPCWAPWKNNFVWKRTFVISLEIWSSHFHLELVHICLLIELNSISNLHQLVQLVCRSAVVHWFLE